MNLDQISHQIFCFSAIRNMTVGGLVSRHLISGRSLERARISGIKTLHTATALILLLHDMRSSDRTMEFQCRGIEFVLLTKSDYLALLAARQANPVCKKERATKMMRFKSPA